MIKSNCSHKASNLTAWLIAGNKQMLIIFINAIMITIRKGILVKQKLSFLKLKIDDIIQIKIQKEKN